MHAIGPRHRANLAVYRRFVPLLKPSWLPLAVALAASACTPLLFAARIWLLKVLIDTVLRGQRPDLLVALAGGFIAIAVARSMLTYIEDKLSGAGGYPGGPRPAGGRLHAPAGTVPAIFPHPAPR